MEIKSGEKTKDRSNQHQKKVGRVASPCTGSSVNGGSEKTLTGGERGSEKNKFCLGGQGEEESAKSYEPRKV